MACYEKKQAKFCRCWRASVATLSDDGEDEEEEVDDVEVEVERREDVLLGRDRVLVLPAHHELSVEDDVLQRERVRCARGGSPTRCEELGWMIASYDREEKSSERRVND